MQHPPRLKSITGVARALITTVGVREATAILVAQFGWDTAFTALSRVEMPEAGAALWLAVEQLAGDHTS